MDIASGCEDHLTLLGFREGTCAGAPLPLYVMEAVPMLAHQGNSGIGVVLAETVTLMQMTWEVGGAQ